MALNATMRVAEIEALAGTIDSQRSALESQLNQLASQCARADQFTGSAAEQYDGWMAKWRTSQDGMLQAMHEAGQLLHRYTNALSELEDHVSRGFTI